MASGYFLNKTKVNYTSTYNVTIFNLQVDIEGESLKCERRITYANTTRSHRVISFDFLNIST